MIVEMIVQRTDIEVYIGVSLCERLNAFGCCDDAKEVQLSAAMLFEHVNRCQGGTAGREHRIYDENLSFRAVSRKLAVIFDRRQCLGISVERGSEQRRASCP